MKDPLQTTWQVQVRSADYGWIIWELNDHDTLKDAQRVQQEWNNKNKEARIVEITKRVFDPRDII